MAIIAASGELGATTGPWTARPLDDPAKTGHGQYFSIWQRDLNGSFRLLADIGSAGIAQPCPSTVRPLVSGEALPGNASEQDRQQRRSALRREDSARNRQQAPAPAAQLALRGEAMPTAEVESHYRMAQSGDFGVSWGGLGKPAKGGYLRLWTFHDGQWQLQMEVQP